VMIKSHVGIMHERIEGRQSGGDHHCVQWQAAGIFLGRG
jgi:hypothetical protein